MRQTFPLAICTIYQRLIAFFMCLFLALVKDEMEIIVTFELHSNFLYFLHCEFELAVYKLDFL